MRKTAAALITLGLAALALAGCASAPAFDGQPCPTRSDSPALSDSVSVKGDLGSEPRVTVRTPMKVQKTTVDVLTHGSGTAVTEKNQPLSIDFTLYDGGTGKQLGSTGFDGQGAQTLDLSTLASQSKEFSEALQCATAGSRLLIGFPAGAAAKDASVAVVDVRKVYLPHAEGSLQYNDALGLPTVVRAPDGRPGIIVPDAAKPTKLVSQTLIKGTGPKVKPTDTVRVQYTGVDWDSKTVFDSSWDKQSASFPLDQVIPGFGKGLAGQTVGSQVLLVVPPKDGYGAQGGGAVKPNATLVFVVDILGIDPPAAATSGQ
ncbi:FKBP-type peptidyl-prolyl cis-trans isomerase [Microbacterium sp. 22242]|uniref:FKBP-type peptidyl-prolyl cis-trans isomerase n=1 Tax=Microbacterium sp. 22242 TaxID=3453896 RepID=UPI003F82BAC0